LFAADDSFQLEPIVISPSRFPTSKFNTNRNVIIIPGDEISSLYHVSPIDIRRRGANDSTADVSIRGAGFEETLILLNGIPLNDPQTGHHNLDIPLTQFDIERIEIMPGAASSLYGSAASGGVINIITRLPDNKTKKARISFGDHQFKQAGFGIDFPFHDLANRISFETTKSGGFRHNTELDLMNFSFQSTLSEKICYFLGYQEKDFGANGFYSLSFPDQQEETKTFLTTLEGEFDKFEHTFYPKLFYRRHADRYQLDETRSNWYLNQHTSYSYGGELSTVRKLHSFDYLAGASIIEDEITSTNLGDHDRGHQAVFLQGQARILNDKVLLGAGIREDHYAGWDWEPSPSINAGFFASRFLKLRTSVGRSFRVPSFTELYYTSSTSQGNPNLTPEKSWTYEIGFDTIGKYQGLGVTVFRREGEDIIDWARASAADPWVAENIEDITTDGVEIEYQAWPKFLRLNYTYLDPTRNKTTQSRYVLDYLKHQLEIKLDFEQQERFKETINITYKSRVEDDPYWSVDAKASYQLNPQALFFIEATNLFNKTFVEQGDLPMPDRWLKTGLEYQF